MSYDDAWAALNGEMPATIPRTEYSASGHWPLVSAAIGRQVAHDSPPEARAAAERDFMRAWDFGMIWSIGFGGQHIQGRKTDMGHAVYADGGGDYRPEQSCPFAEPEDVLAYDAREEAGALDHAGLVRRFNEHYRGQAEQGVDAVRMTGVYVTLFSGLIEIFGWEQLLMAAGDDPEGFGRVAERYAAWIQPVFEALAESESPVVMVHDDICWTEGPVLAPDWYRRYVFPAYRRYFAPLLEAGKRILYTSDGDYTMFFDDIVQAGAHSLVMEPCSDMGLFAERYGRTHGFVGNADTRVLLSGDRAKIRAEVERCIAIGRDCPGFIMAVGNHIPANTPVDAALYYNQCFEELRQRR